MNYLYNGVELPDISFLLGNGNNAIITYYEPTGNYSVYCGNGEYYLENSYLFPRGYAWRVACRLTNGVWVVVSNNSGLNSLDTRSEVVVWSNFNIYNYDKTKLFFAASDPVPVPQLNHAALMQVFFVGQAIRRMRGKREPIGYLYGREAKEGETILSGLSKYTINGKDYIGVVLPKLPEWDSTIYPYAVIERQRISTSIYYYLNIFHKQHYCKEDGYHGTVYAIELPVRMWRTEGDSWSEPYDFKTEDASETNGVYWTNTSEDKIIWSNYTIRYDDPEDEKYNTVFMEKSPDPIPIYE